MHVELIVPGLLAAAPAARLPALELLLARGRAAHDAPQPPGRWLAGAFGVRDGAPPAGALSVLGCGGDPADGYWMRADPVHLHVGSEGVTLVPGAALGIDRAEAEALVDALNRHFGSEFAFQALRPSVWCLRAARDLPLEASSPAEHSGGADGSLLPQGSEARRSHALMAEIQMALHGHPVNLGREERGTPPINGVWLWGAGRLPPSARGPWRSVLSDDPVASGLARLAGVPHAPLPGAAAQWLERAPGEGRHLCVLEPLPGVQAAEGDERREERLAALERDWFAPLLEALRRGRAGMLTLRVPDAGRAWEATRADLRRFWRRPRPLAAAT